jgi:AraC-like DNA-binding protein
MPNPSYLPAFESIISFQLALSVFAGIKTFAPLLLRQDLPIRRVNFAIDRVEIASSVQQFFACPIYFGQGKNSIEVDVDLMSLDLTFADPTMFDALTKHAESLLLGSDDQNDFLRRVQALIPEALRRQNFKIEDLASELNASARTVQRKLKEQGYTYQKLVDETRLKLAKVHLRENQLSMSEIAFMVGYQEQSSFNHAFKSWTKLSPREFRLKYSH